MLGRKFRSPLDRRRFNGPRAHNCTPFRIRRRGGVRDRAFFKVMSGRLREISGVKPTVER